MSGWTIAWLVWLGAFLVIEGAAFVKTRDAEGTLSANVWRWFHVYDVKLKPVWIAARVVLGAFLLWLLLHLTFGVMTLSHPLPWR